MKNLTVILLAGFLALNACEPRVKDYNTNDTSHKEPAGAGSDTINDQLLYPKPDSARQQTDTLLNR